MEGTCIVKGFAEHYVGPLDHEGCLPGVYYATSVINVQFEGEDTVQENLNLGHFIVLDATDTVTSHASLDQQLVRELPNAIEFWPGDTVRKIDDLFGTPRTIEHVQIDDNGEVIYVLTESKEQQRQRSADREWQRVETSRHGILASTFDHPRSEVCQAAMLILVKRGNVYHLYCEPEQLSFASPTDEIQFWTNDGLSRIIYDDDFSLIGNYYRLDIARMMLENREGDLMVSARTKTYGGEPIYQVRRLHDIFGTYRERVRALSLSLFEQPTESDPEPCFFDDE